MVPQPSLARAGSQTPGATINIEWDYQEPLQQDWHSVLLADAAVSYRPSGRQAFNLVGQDGTGNDEAGVHYHFICVVGRCSAGFICINGDNWQIENELVIYSYATLQAADICGLLMLNVVDQSIGAAMDTQFFKQNADGSYTCVQNGSSSSTDSSPSTRRTAGCSGLVYRSTTSTRFLASGLLSSRSSSVVLSCGIPPRCTTTYLARAQTASTTPTSTAARCLPYIAGLAPVSAAINPAVVADLKIIQSAVYGCPWKGCLNNA